MDSLSAEEILWTYRSMSQHISCKTASRLIQIINQRIISCHCFKYPVKYLLRHHSFYRNRDNVFSIHYPFIKASIYYLLVFIQLIVVISVYYQPLSPPDAIPSPPNPPNVPVLPHQSQVNVSPVLMLQFKC